jgi:hypothetical protein
LFDFSTPFLNNTGPFASQLEYLIFQSCENEQISFGIFLCEAQWLAHAFPYRRFAVALAGDRARFRVDADRYSFIVSDLHQLLLAGLSGALRKIRAYYEARNDARSNGDRTKVAVVLKAVKVCPGKGGIRRKVRPTLTAPASVGFVIPRGGAKKL